ncbi:MAG: N-6 DNA methylase [Dehalococcoidia bacterium]|nr:N-6 DNA methylase [Dehalococcoidia bacterium]
MANIADIQSIIPTLQAIRARLDLTQEQLAERLGVSFTTVNRWEGGVTRPQRAARTAIAALAAEAGIDSDAPSLDEAESAAHVTRRRSRRRQTPVPTTKPMEQMLWDSACSIRGAKDAAKFKDYLLPLLFLKRLSDVFDDEIERLTQEFGDRAIAQEIAESDHGLLRFYLPPEARWSVVSGREAHDWPLDARGRSTRPRDIGEHLTSAVRAVVRYNPTLSGVIDLVDFASERNGERDLNPARLSAVVETFSDPRYRLGLADVQPDFLGRAYEYLLRKFAEGSGQSAGEFFTPTEVGFLMAHIMRPRPGETCHDYACGSAGLLIKLQLVAREADPTSRVPLRLYGQELQADSYAVAHMNAIIHDMEVQIERGDTMINPKFKDAAGRITGHDVVVANPMWNQDFNRDIFENDSFDRFRAAGGVTTGRGDWAWLQHTLACLNERGRAAVVLDTGAVTRGSGARHEDRERNIRKWFVERDLIDGVILLPDNLFYNTSAAGIIVVLSKRKPEARRDKIVLVNASRRVGKGRPKNFIPQDDIQPIAAMFLKGEPVEGEVAVITREQAEEADYNLSPSRWVGQTSSTDVGSVRGLLAELATLDEEAQQLSASLHKLLEGVGDEPA